MNEKYSVILPGAGEKELSGLIRILKEQKIAPDRIFTGTGDENTVINENLRKTETPFVWILSPDAVPEEKEAAGRMLACFSDPEVSAVYSSQRGGENGTGISEAFQQAFFPDNSVKKEERDIYFHGMETFFLSNTSCMYRTEDLKRLSPFEPFELNFSEHVKGADLIHLGKKIVYAADAHVTFLHRLTSASALHEGFDYGVLEKRNIQSFGLYVIDDKSYDVIRKNMSEIYREAYREAAAWLAEHGAAFRIPGAWLVYLCLKYGNKLGRRYHRLPMSLNRKLCSVKNYFV